MHYAERINRHTSAVNAAAFCLPLGEAPLSARHAYITLSLDRPQKRGIECRERAGYNDCLEYPEDNAIFLSARWPRRHKHNRAAASPSIAARLRTGAGTDTELGTRQGAE